MRPKTRPVSATKSSRSPWIQLAWLVTIWVASVLSLGVVAMLIRWAVKPG